MEQTWFIDMHNFYRKNAQPPPDYIFNVKWDQNLAKEAN